MAEDWISITEAAQRLSNAGDVVSRSTLSRYVTKHQLGTRRDGKSTLVDYVALKQHRDENIRIEISPVETASAVERSASKLNTEPALPSRSNGSARKALADAEIREMDLAERRKQLTPTAEVDRAARDAVALMRSSFERAVETEAPKLSVKYGWDERTARLALKQFARTGLDVFHREALKLQDQIIRQSTAEHIEGEAQTTPSHAETLQ